MHASIEDIKSVFSKDLPGEKAHDQIMDYPRPTVKEILDGERTVRRSAVTFLLFKKEDSWHFILLKRHDYEGVHSGQVGLPGGSLDYGESEIQAAIRELHEETGVELKKEDYISALTPLYIPPSNFIVQPYVAVVVGIPEWRFDEKEVKVGMEIPLNELMASDSLIQDKVKLRGSGGHMKVKGFSFQDELIWGATAMILAECKEILLNLAP